MTTRKTSDFTVSVKVDGIWKDKFTVRAETQGKAADIAARKLYGKKCFANHVSGSIFQAYYSIKNSGAVFFATSTGNPFIVQ